MAEHAQTIPLIVQAIMDTVLAQVRNQNLFHAAAMTDGAAACLILGDSGWGKTTLALALSQLGMQLLSDEIGAVDTAGYVHAYPRAIRVRPPTMTLLGVHNQHSYAGINPFQQQASKLNLTARTARLDHLFFLTSPDARRQTRGRRVFITGASTRLCQALACMPGIARIVRDGVTMTVSTDTLAPASLVDDIRARCRQHGALVLCSGATACTRPAFLRNPRVEEMPVHVALQWLLPHLIGGPVAAVRRQQSGALQLYTNLAGAVGHTRCYHVRPGEPRATAAELCTIMDANRDTTLGAHAPRLEHGQRRQTV